MLIKSQTEYKLKSPPEDAISSVKFGPNTSQFLLVGSWDNSVRLYDVTANTLRHKYAHESPVFDVCFQVSKYFCIQNSIVDVLLNFILGCSPFIQWWIGSNTENV